MKQGSFRAVRLLVFLLVMVSLGVFPVFGDENTVDYLSIILDPFDGTTNHQWSFGGKTYSYDYEWAIDASKFTHQGKDDDGNVIEAEVYPQKTFVPAWPMALYGANKDGKDIQSFGIKGKFDRRGYNWIDVYPIVPGSAESDDGPQPFEIPIPGRIQYLDMWVWGSNLRYYMEAFFRDHQGVIYTLRLGELGYQGWKNLRTRIPTSVPQSKRVLPRLAGLTFVKFRVWTTPTERVDEFYIYFNQMKVLTDTFESIFDGDELADPDRVNELWSREESEEVN